MHYFMFFVLTFHKFDIIKGFCYSKLLQIFETSGGPITTSGLLNLQIEQFITHTHFILLQDILQKQQSESLQESDQLRGKFVQWGTLCQFSIFVSGNFLLSFLFASFGLQSDCSNIQSNKSLDLTLFPASEMYQQATHSSNEKKLAIDVAFLFQDCIVTCIAAPF